VLFIYLFMTNAHGGNFKKLLMPLL